MKTKPLQLSQNFFKSKHTVKKLLSIANIRKTDIIYEIGAGKGIITRELSGICKSVYAIEYDRELYSYLLRNINYKNIRYINTDILKYSLPDNGRYKVFANIPYAITTDILGKLLFFKNPPVDSFIIIQKEAAERFAGSPYKNDTLKSLLLKPFFLFEILYELEPTDFHPPPDVSSVFLRIKKHNDILLNEKEKNIYYDFLTYVFLKRRGSLMNRLITLLTKKQLLLLSSRYCFDPGSGIHDLLYQQWILIFFYYLYNVSDEKKKLTGNCYSWYRKEQLKINKMHRNRNS